MRTAAALGLALALSLSRAAYAQDDDEPLPPPPPPPPGARLPDERPTAPTPPPPPPSARPEPGAAPKPAPPPAPSAAAPAAPAPSGASTPPPLAPDGATRSAPGQPAATEPPATAAPPGAAPPGPALSDLPTPPPPPQGAEAQPPLTEDVALGGDDRPPPKKPEAKRWYGWQMFVIDGSALFLFFVEKSGTHLLSYPAYFLGGPIVHLSHKQGVRALVSLATRIGAPVLMGEVVKDSQACTPMNHSGCVNGIHPSIFFAALGAAAFDGVFLAKLPAPPKEASVSAPPVTWSLTPTVAADRKGAGVVLYGSF